MKKRKNGVGAFCAVRDAAAAHPLLTAGTLLCTALSVLASLLPPLLLGRAVDRLTGGMPLAFSAALLYFGSLALEGLLSAGQETLLELFGQTPPEIAVSIAAEMIRHRALRAGSDKKPSKE